MNTTHLITLMILLAAVMLMLTWAQRAQRKKRVQASYTARRVLSAPEAVLFLRLQQALPKHFILAQVSMHRVLTATSGGKAAFNSIAQKAIDFVVCRKDFSVACVIELDDASHRKDRDTARDGLLSGADITTVRFDVKAIPSVGDIGQKLRPFVEESFAPGNPRTPS